MLSNDIGKFDPAMATKPANTDGVAWHLPFEEPFSLLGLNWFETDHAYNRLPISNLPETFTRYDGDGFVSIPAKGFPVLELATHTAGVQVRFRTDSSRFLLQGENAFPYGMDHMAFTGSAGFDLYLNDNGTWTCYGVTRTDHSVTSFSTTITSGLKREMRDVIIDFPLYNGVKSLSIGLDEDAAIEAPTPLCDPRPLVFYGTSITQGGCCTRPGMCSSNILSRMLNREVINLGFSGNGRAEPEVARMLADIKNPGAYLLDHAWNNQIKEFTRSLPNLIDTIRKAHPDTPIVLVAPTPGREHLPSYASPSPRLLLETEVMRQEAEKRTAAGDRFITFFNGHEALGNDFWECLVDGSHLTDLGFLKFSQAILPHLQKILA